MATGEMQKLRLFAPPAHYRGVCALLLIGVVVFGAPQTRDSALKTQPQAGLAADSSTWPAAATSIKTPVVIPGDTNRPPDGKLVADSTRVPTDSTHAASPKVVSQPDTIDYNADKIEYDIHSKTLLLSGKAVVRYKNMVLNADTIHYVIAKDIFVASGTPQLIDGADTIVGVGMIYNIKTRRGRIRYASAHSGDTRYNGEIIAKSDSNVYYMEGADYSSCAVVDSPHYCFYANNIKVLPGKQTISRPVVLNIGNAPVAALPFFVLPMEKGRQSGLLRPSWGGHPGGGGYMQNLGYYFAPNDYTDFKLAGEVREFQTFVVSASSQYKIKYLLDGYLSGRYTLSTGKDKLSKQWDIDYSHRQPLLPDGSMTISGQGRLASSSSFYRTFSEDTSELLNQQITANLALSKQFKKINASASVSWNRNQNLKRETVDENLPSFSFSLPQRPLIPYTAPVDAKPGSEEAEPGWYTKILYGYSAQGLLKRKYSTLDSLKQDKFVHAGLNNTFSLSYNHTVFKWFNLSPSFNANLSVFDATIDTNAIHSTRITKYRCNTAVVDPSKDLIIDTLTDKTPVLYVVERDTALDVIVYDTIPGIAVAPPSWNAGVSLSTNLYGLFPINVFALRGIRHTFSPSVNYTYTPERELSKKYPDVVSYTGAQKRAQTVSFAVRNLFQGKTVDRPRPGSAKNVTVKDAKPRENKFTIMSGPDISMSYDFEKKSRPWSDIGVTAGNANPVVGVNFSARFTPYDEKDQLTLPALMQYSISLNPRVISAKGSFWSGDLLVLDKLQPTETSLPPARGSEGWSISINPSYSLSRSRTTPAAEFITTKTYQLSSSAQVAFSSMWSLSWSGRYDFQTNKLESNTIYFHCNLECWDMRFEWTPSGYNPGFRFNVGIVKHPDIKWEHRDLRRNY
jgi:lipopolysaccharide assembly outer membrane protein LptD (OstA)